MNTNFQINTQTFKSLHEPLQNLQKTSLFTKLFKTNDNRVVKRREFTTKKEYLMWKNNITQELLNQRILSSKYPSRILSILNYTVEINNHQRNLYITYDCGSDAEPLYQYLNNNNVIFQEQIQIFEQLLQLACILYNSQFEHTNIKPNNILYYKKQVLLTDFGSARTHYQNFLKEYTSKAEKEWQSNLIFFYPEEYQKIVEQENDPDLRNWKDLDISNQKFRKWVDIWALGMMMIQVFENNQTLPKKISDYYGLNNKLLLNKIDSLKQQSSEIISQTIFSLIIEKQDPEIVYKEFIKQKQKINNPDQSYMESTFTIKQIFDYENLEDTLYQTYKPENYFLDNKDIQKLQGQFDDDASSVKSSNYIIDIENYNEQKPNSTLTFIPNQQNPSRIQSATSRQIPQTQKFEFVNNNGQNLDPAYIQQEKKNENQNKKPSIIVQNYDLMNQNNQVSQFDDIQFKNPNNQSPIFNQNSSQQFQFLEAQKLNNVHDNGDNFSGIVSFQNSQDFKFINTDQKKESQQQLNLINIDDFDIEGSNNPVQDPKKQEIIQIGKKGFSLQQVEDDDNDKVKSSHFQIDKDIININDAQTQKLQPFEEDQSNGNQINKSGKFKSQIYNEEDQQLLIQVADNKEIENTDNNKNQQTSKINIVKNEQSFLLMQSFDDGGDTDGQNKKKNNQFSLNIITNILSNGVTQLNDEVQNDVLNQLKVVQKILKKVEQHHYDPKEIVSDDDDKEEQTKIKEVINEIIQKKDIEKLKLIEDVNDGIGFILKKKEVDKIFNNNEVEKVPLILNILNQEQLKFLKEKAKENKLLTTEIQQLIELKDGLEKLKLNPNVQNILKNEQIGLLNKEELKIYKHLLDIIPKDKGLSKRILTQQSAIEARLKDIKKVEEEEQMKRKLVDFLKDPSFDKLLPNDYLKKLNDDERQKYKAALDDFMLKATKRQKKSIQEQIDIINEINKKMKVDSKIIKIDEVDEDDSTRQSKKDSNTNFQDAYLQVVKKLENQQDFELLSLNQYIREFQLTPTLYQITDLIPNDCLNYQKQNKKRKIVFYDFQGSKYKGETFNEQPDGIGILRKTGVSSIYKGYFKQGKFYWGQVLEMNDKGQLTQYIGYYNQEYQVKHGIAKLRWFQPQKIGFCGGYLFDNYEFYEGSFLFGYIHGKGKKTYADQSYYEGEWKKNKKSGQGLFTKMKDGNKTITYDGQFLDDKQHGNNIKAIHHHSTGFDLIVQGEYRYGKPIGQHKLIFNEVVQRDINY